MNLAIISNILKTYIVRSFYFKNNENPHVLCKVDDIYVINLKKEKMKRNYIIQLFKKLKLNFHLIIVEPISKEIYKNAVKNDEITQSEFGCLLSHLWCLKKIINKNQNAIIFEDDIFIHKNFVNLWNNINSDTHYDFLLLGSCDFSFARENKYNVDIVNNIYQMQNKCQKVYGAHANYYSIEAAKFWYDYKCKNIEFFDKNYYDIFSHFQNSSGICYPNLAITDISYSNNDHAYPLLSEKENEYYKRCFTNLNFKDYHIFYPILFKNVLISQFNSVEKLIDHLLYIYFHNENKSLTIKNRLDIHLFTINEIKYIIDC